MKNQLVQLGWRIYALIESRESKAEEIKDHKMPQNFKLNEMMIAQAEELRILLRQCGIPEPPKKTGIE